VLARAEWNDPAIAEGLMSDDRANLIAGTMTNLFIVSDNRILTAPVNECGIAGILRSKVLSWADELGIDSAEQYFGRADLEAATEVFLTNSLIGIWPVNQVEELRFAVGPQTERFIARWRSAGAASE
jgi:4-amino-4-deoxychorismate lyase